MSFRSGATQAGSLRPTNGGKGQMQLSLRVPAGKREPQSSGCRDAPWSRLGAALEPRKQDPGTSPGLPFGAFCPKKNLRAPYQVL